MMNPAFSCQERSRNSEKDLPGVGGFATMAHRFIGTLEVSRAPQRKGN
jgi:hypothetical protein